MEWPLERQKSMHEKWFLLDRSMFAGPAPTSDERAAQSPSVSHLINAPPDDREIAIRYSGGGVT